MNREEANESLDGHRLKITVVGLGHLGTVAVAALAMAGHDVLGVDIDDRRTRLLNNGETPVYEPMLRDWLRHGLASGNLQIRHRDEVSESLGDIAMIATGTPPTSSGAVDLRQVWSALSWIKSLADKNTVVVMKSTVPPGTGCTILNRDLKGLGMSYIANPEFLREGRALEDWQHPDRIVIGTEEGADRSVRLVREMYSGIQAPVMVTDITSAEMIKYASNAFLATRISFINEIASLCDRVGASIDDVSSGLALDTRTGNVIRAGVGYGGSCFPKDVRALDYIALTSGVNVDLLRSVITINNRQRLLPLRELRRRFRGSVDGLTVGILGLAFKPDTDDVRESVCLDLINALVDENIKVQAYDPKANEAAKLALPSEVAFVEDPVQAAQGAQALMLLTEWKEIIEGDWEAMASGMHPPKFLYDGRNALDPDLMLELGLDYVGVGRGRVNLTGGRLQRGD